jgi:hypothetical protein
MDLGLTALTFQQIGWMLRETFDSILAPLLPTTVFCTSWGVFAFSLGGPNFAVVPPFKHGTLIATPSDPNDSVVVLAFAGGYDKGNTKRIYIPFIPASYHEERVLTTFGQEQVLTRMRALFSGCDGARGGFGPRLIVWQQGKPVDRFGPARPTRFAEVEQLVTCSNVDRAPLLIG